MGNCQYCGMDAGLLRHTHLECQQKHDAGRKVIVSAVVDVIQTGSALETVQSDLTKMGKLAYIPEARLKEIMAAGWAEALQRFLEDDVLSEDEESRLMTFADKFGLSQEQLNVNGAYTRATMAAVLRDVLNGKTPARIHVDGAVPFNLQETESLVWAYPKVPYYEERIHRSYIGNYHGMSVRVAKGVYYRFGGFQSNPVETSQMEQIDAGMLGVTTKHLYFAGYRKSFRVPYTKIVTIIPLTDAIGICKDAASAKPQYFIMGEGWFIYNLVKNLSHRD